MAEHHKGREVVGFKLFQKHLSVQQLPDLLKWATHLLWLGRDNLLAQSRIQRGDSVEMSRAATPRRRRPRGGSRRRRIRGVAATTTYQGGRGDDRYVSVCLAQKGGAWIRYANDKSPHTKATDVTLSDEYARRAKSPRRRGRGDAAAATWIFRGDEVAATPRLCDVDTPRRRGRGDAAAARRGYSADTRSRRRRGRDVDISAEARSRARARRGYSAGTTENYGETRALGTSGSGRARRRTSCLTRWASCRCWKSRARRQRF